MSPLYRRDTEAIPSLIPVYLRGSAVQLSPQQARRTALQVLHPFSGR